MHYCECIVTTDISFWLNNRNKRVSSRGPYLSSRMVANSASVLRPCKSCSSLHLWNDTPLFILDFILAVLCFYSSFLRQSSSVYSLGLSLNVFDHVRAGTASARGRGAEWGAARSICMRVIDTSQALTLALIAWVDSCKSNYSNWVDPQTVIFYTADLCLILLSDHNDNFSKYNKKDYNFLG